jgi:uncharacterized protein YcfJ
MKIFIALLMFFMTFNTAYASDSARITRVTPIYQDNLVPVYETQCYETRVPVYRNDRYVDGGDVLGGMIVGGLIGRGITGSDEGTVIGAFLGGLATPPRNQRSYVGDQFETQCERVQVLRSEPIITSYEIEFIWQHNIYRQEVFHRYNVGDVIRVSPSLR